MRVLLCVLCLVLMLPRDVAWGDDQASSATTVGVKKAIKCLFPKSAKLAPDWVCNPRAEGLAVAAVGRATKSQAGIPFMEQMAAADARTRLVRKVRESVREKVMGGAPVASKKSTEREGVLIATITNDTLQGTTIKKHVYGPNGALYVLVGLDAENANLLIESVTAEYLKQNRQ